MELLLLAFFAFVVGILVVSLGGGGGALYVALLPILFKIPLVEATSISITIIIPTTFFGAISHYRNGNVNITKALPMLIFAIIGCIIGTFLTFKSPPHIYNKLVGCVLVIFGLLMLATNKRKIIEGREQSIRAFWIKSVVFGLLAGMVSGYFGLSGTVVTLIALASMGLTVAQIIGTSVFLLFGISTASFLSHLIGITNFNWPVLAALTVGATAGGWLAPILLKRLDVKIIAKVIFPTIALLIIAAGIVFLVNR